MRNAINIGPVVSKVFYELVFVALLSSGLVACSTDMTERITVTMTDGSLTFEPTTVRDARHFEFRFVNQSSNSRYPVVVASAMTSPDLLSYLEANGLEAVLNEIVSEEGGLHGYVGYGTWDLIYPDWYSDYWGHYHPDEDDQPALSNWAITRGNDDGSKIQYLDSPELESDSEMTYLLACCMAGVTWSDTGRHTTFLILTLDGSENYAIFELELETR